MEGEIIEEVKEFKYLSYILQKNGRQEAHIKDKVRRPAAGMGQICLGRGDLKGIREGGYDRLI